MAFDQATRNRLARFVGEARALLTEEFTRQLQLEYGMDPASGTVVDLDEKLSHLDDARRATATLLRETLAHYEAAGAGHGVQARQDAIERIVREQAFTVLNRLCALRMAEARDLLLESVSHGYQSKGFQLYARLAGPALGETGDAYRAYLFSVFDDFAVDLAVLFDRFSPQGRLFPREAALLQLLTLMNQPEIDALWAEDETLGWIYQYFNSKEERKAMRDASPAPRNSRELAVRNQFFTPRYVVEFLTDNTLGRIWYEMTQSATTLADTCRYLMRRPNEIFLAAGAQSPVLDAPDESLSPEELLQQPVYIPHRPLKDPREITMLDPACGSMHFGLYAFDLFERIYEEAWEIEEAAGPTALGRPAGLSLHGVYPSKEEFLRDVPRLIIERNIHGIDIDPRAVQIAGLSLWLRAQKTWRAQALKPQDRPPIRRSNVVCAEPMPGDKGLLEEFITRQLAATPADRAISEMLPPIFKAMELAGEAGSLLKIEEQIAGVVEATRLKYEQALLQRSKEAGYLPGMAPERDTTLLDLLDLPHPEEFWTQAEERIYAALRDYAAQAENGEGYRRRLFADDAARGFAFIDLCRKRYDLVLMNPPFGQPTPRLQGIFVTYPKGTPTNLYTLFMVRMASMMVSQGAFGAITDSTFLKQPTFLQTRHMLLSEKAPLHALIDLGWDVLDANVRTALSVVVCPGTGYFWALDLAKRENRSNALLEAIADGSMTLKRYADFLALPKSVFAIDLSPMAGHKLIEMKNLGDLCSLPWGCGANDSFRLFRLRWEVSSAEVSLSWAFLTNGGSFSPFYRENFLVCRSHMENGESAFTMKFRNGTDALYDASGQELYFLSGLTYPKRSEFFHVAVLPKGHIFTPEGKGLFLINDKQIWFYTGLLNSTFIASIANIVCGPHKQRGDVELIKIPSVNTTDSALIAEQAKLIFKLGQHLMLGEESSTVFLYPGTPTSLLSAACSFREILDMRAIAISEARANALEGMKRIDKLLTAAVPSELSQFCEHPNLWEERSKIWSDLGYQVDTILSYLFGTILGRWDILYATGEKPAPDLPDPFAPLPICPPGMLQNAQGISAEPSDVPADYPLRISWPGILVDDEGHPEDIEHRLREVLHIIWQDRADTIEQEASQILGVHSLRDYFRKPAGFFADHLSRYSKSRRQAPIYWPLSTPSGNYTLWLYYHRLTDQTLYSCVNDFVDPKLKQVAEQVAGLQRKSGRSAKEEKILEQLSNLERELHEFRAELLRIAAFWQPNLNDGVQITAAPLWQLFQHKPWQKRLKETWVGLEAGEYDWAHLSYSIWPDRVRAKCRTDKSLAITHDLEDLYVTPPATGGPKRGRAKQSTLILEDGFNED